MTMPPFLRKLMLVCHVSSSVSSLGAVACFLVLAHVALGSEDLGTALSPCVAMQSVARLVTVPLVFASLLAGLGSSTRYRLGPVPTLLGAGESTMSRQQQSKGRWQKPTFSACDSHSWFMLRAVLSR